MRRTEPSVIFTTTGERLYPGRMSVDHGGRSVAATAKKVPKTGLSVVVFRVSFDPQDTGLLVDEAMMQVFAFSPPVKLREETRTKAQYVAGNYDQLPSGAWVGQIEMQRTSLASQVHRDPTRGNILKGSTEEVTTSEHRSTYAYSPERNIVAYRDTAAIPHTRLRSFVRAAEKKYEGRRFHLDIVPIKSKLTLAQMIESFEELHNISVRFRHSQSPGDAFIDSVVDELNAAEAIEQVKAKPKQSLNKRALLTGRTQIAKAIQHVEVNNKNGSATIVGVLHDEVRKIDSKSAIERRSIDATDTTQGHKEALAFFANRFHVDEEE